MKYFKHRMCGHTEWTLCRRTATLPSIKFKRNINYLNTVTNCCCVFVYISIIICIIYLLKEKYAANICDFCCYILCVN